MDRGYIKLWRCIQHNPVWNYEKFSRGQAWLDLIMLANHKDSSVRKRGIKIEVKRGQVGWSERQLADRWQWSRGKVARFLEELENEQQIIQQNGPQNINVTSLITIVNYEKYQSDEPQNEPQMIPQTGRKRAANSTMNKNEKNEKNEKKESIPKIAFSENVSMTQNEFDKLVESHGQPKTDWMIAKLETYKKSSGKKYKCDYSAILSWVVGEAEKNYKPLASVTPTQSAMGTPEQLAMVQRLKEREAASATA